MDAMVIYDCNARRMRWCWVVEDATELIKVSLVGREKVVKSDFGFCGAEVPLLLQTTVSPNYSKVHTVILRSVNDGTQYRCITRHVVPNSMLLQKKLLRIFTITNHTTRIENCTRLLALL